MVALEEGETVEGGPRQRDMRLPRDKAFLRYSVTARDRVYT